MCQLQHHQIIRDGLPARGILKQAASTADQPVAAAQGLPDLPRLHPVDSLYAIHPGGQLRVDGEHNRLNGDASCLALRLQGQQNGLQHCFITAVAEAIVAGDYNLLNGVTHLFHPLTTSSHTTINAKPKIAPSPTPSRTRINEI
ncbi:hypothetical protein D3C76_1403860 [compost metagenome]